MASGFNWSSILNPSGRKIDLSELRQFEAILGSILPDDYRAFLLALNGGHVFIDHEIHVPELSSDTFLNCLWPLTAESPSLGIKEAHDIQVKQRLGLRQAVRIGDDMGTGFFFLILDGNERGAVYFSFKDDLALREGDWYSTKVCIPRCLAKISQTFTQFGKKILLNEVKT